MQVKPHLSYCTTSKFRKNVTEKCGVTIVVFIPCKGGQTTTGGCTTLHCNTICCSSGSDEWYCHYWQAHIILCLCEQVYHSSHSSAVSNDDVLSFESG